MAAGKHRKHRRHRRHRARLAAPARRLGIVACLTLGLAAAPLVLQLAGDLSSGAATSPDATASAAARARELSRVPVGDLPGWRQVFVEDFSRPAPLGSFASSPYYGPRFARTYKYPWKDTSGNGTYDPARTLSVADGALDIHLHTVGSEIAVAAVEPTLPEGARGQTYGRYAIRFRADPVPGFKTAWLLWPDSGLRSEGEIDFPEGHLDGRIKAYLHHASNDGSLAGTGTQDRFLTKRRYAEWHTAITEWTPGRVRFLLDGRLVGTTTEAVPDRAMHWVIQTETSLDGDVPPPEASGHVSIDWVAVWAFTGATRAP